MDEQDLHHVRNEGVLAPPPPLHFVHKYTCTCMNAMAKRAIIS